MKNKLFLHSKSIILFIFCLGSTLLNGKHLIASPLDTLPVIYLIPGQGADHRLFDSLKVDKAFTVKHIKYSTPSKNMTMEEYAKELSAQIDTTSPFILVGVSLGGMLST